jgi:hypothetical protein
MKILGCPKCHREIVCTSAKNPKRVLAGHLANCSKEKIHEVQLNLLNYENIYEEYDCDQNSETDSLIYPIEVSNETIFNHGEELVLNSTYLLCQISLMDQLNQDVLNPLIKRSRIHDSFGTRGQGHFIDYIEIHSFITRTGLSLMDGNDLLRLICDISKRQKQHICLPKNMRTIRSKIDNITHLLHIVNEVIIPYPAELFNGLTDLKPVKGYYLNPLRIISEYLLSLKEGDIILSPIDQLTKDGNQIISHYVSGKQFKLICQYIKETIGSDCSPICLAVNYDAMPLASYGNRNLKPLKISILNIKKTTSHIENIMTVAFGPQLPYSDSQYERYLSTIIHTSSKKAKCIQYIKRSVF